MENPDWRKWATFISYLEIGSLLLCYLAFLGTIGYLSYQLFSHDDFKRVWVGITVGVILIVGTLIFTIKLWTSNGLRAATNFKTASRDALNKAHTWQIVTIIFAALDIVILFVLFTHEFTVPAIAILCINLYRTIVFLVIHRFVKELENSVTAKSQYWRLWARCIAFTELMVISTQMFIGLLVLVYFILLNSNEGRMNEFVNKHMLWIFCGGIYAFQLIGLWASISLFQSTNTRINPDDAFGKTSVWRTINLIFFYGLILTFIFMFVGALFHNMWWKVFVSLVIVIYRGLALNIVAIFANELENASDCVDEEYDHDHKHNTSIKILMKARNPETNFLPNAVS